MSKVIINKNRGWRGLAEVKVMDNTGNITQKNIFSFSQEVWDDLIIQYTIVLQDKDYYYVMELNHTECVDKLPKPEQQRSVLIKNKEIAIKCVNVYEKASWTSATGYDWAAIRHFIQNRNTHTTSSWNCIGIRVVPEI